MIVDLQKFLKEESVYWKELEGVLDKLAAEPVLKMSIGEVKRFHYLYQRASAGLARIAAFSAEPEIRRYLEALVARAYGEIQEEREKPNRFSLTTWLFATFPQTVRRHYLALAVSLIIVASGCLFGGAAITFDPESKSILLPFAHLQDSPAKRVAEEEAQTEDLLKNKKMRGTAFYMTHNTQVSIVMIALGVTYGIGTIILLFYNGVMIGAVALDYILAGKTAFLVAWLSPHGVVEIPAFLLAGQTGLMIAYALIGWGRRIPIRERLRKVSGDVVTMIFGVALLLTWAGFIEAFVSQYHEPVIPYAVKTGFAVIELIVLILFFGLAGMRKTKHAKR